MRMRFCSYRVDAVMLSRTDFDRMPRTITNDQKKAAWSSIVIWFLHQRHRRRGAQADSDEQHKGRAERRANASLRLLSQLKLLARGEPVHDRARGELAHCVVGRTG